MGTSQSTEPWLPDFCRPPRILVMLGMAQLVVLLVALWPGDGNSLTLGQFFSASAFSLWLALSIAVLLCVSRRHLSQLPVALGAASALGLTVFVAACVAGVVYGLYMTLGKPPVQVGFGRFVLGSAAIALLITAFVLRYFYVSDRWEAQLNANARAEADALQARIRPHFLFNSMNLIASLVRRDPVVAERAVLDLSDLFRAALGASEGDSNLAQEVELARRYLSIESLRLCDRLQVEWDLKEPLPWSMKLPHLVLQPLVENSVLHGISRLPEGGKLEIGVWVDQDLLHVRICNPAPSPQAASLSIQAGTGHAQKNIAYRLAYKHGPEAVLQGSWSGGDYTCDLVLPLA